MKIVNSTIPYASYAIISQAEFQEWIDEYNKTEQGIRDAKLHRLMREEMRRVEDEIFFKVIEEAERQTKGGE